MAVTGESEFAKELLKALGLDYKDVVQFELDITVGEIVIVTVERHLSKEEAQKMIPLFQKYKLVKREE